MRVLLVWGTVGVAFLLIGMSVTPAVSRSYWPTSIDTMWAGHQKHTHAAVTGVAKYCRTEEDGDRHIRLESPGDSTKFIIAEIIPLIPLPCPKKGQVITVNGITRYDPEHGWREIHPVETWTP